MTVLPFRTATQLAAAIRSKKISCVELLELYLKRIEKHNPRLNAIIALDVAGARKRARAADKALAKDDIWGPLHGVPMTIKESFNVAGLPTTWGDLALRSNIADSDALAVTRLKAAGVVLFGKTNVPLMLADWQSYNAIYGITNNPWDVTRTPGGSSGGSAAALAAGLTGIEAGSDIGASIRNPAHYCGVFGHKPTWGILSQQGHALPGKVAEADIAVIGPLARGAEDLEIAFEAMTGPDAIDGNGWRAKLPKPAHKKLRDFKVAVMLEDRNSTVDDEVKSLIQALADRLGKLNVKVSDVARPDIDTDELQRVYIQLLRAATSGRQTDAEFALNAAEASRLPGNDQGYYARMMRANTISHRDWLAANERRHQLRRKWAAFFEDYDLLLCPAAASAAFPHDHVGERYQRTIEVNGRRVATTDQLFWAGFNGVCYLPGTVAPIGRTPRGLPVGVQIVGPQYGDRTCLRFARLLEREHYAFEPPPGFD
ncbi:MAG TPA: amidase [Vineibacter sp.]|nr:amidase [Vineibacter sp.]